MRSIAHIINVYNAPVNSDTAIAKPIVFESLKKAKSYAAGDLEIEFLSAQYPEDREIVPSLFRLTTDLKESVLDFGVFPDKRKLPLTREILKTLYENSTAEYFVYTNADIGLMPYFYSSINEIIEKGHDAFIINRRRISDKYNSVKDIELIYSEAGMTHTGYDCFVFKRDLYPKFVLKNVCSGIPHAWNDLAHNFFCFAENPKLFTDKHLTFHVGMELYKEWGDKTYWEFNKKEFINTLNELKPHFKINNIPGSELPFLKRHFKWLMNPTFHYPTFFSVDMKNLGVKRNKNRVNKNGNLKTRYMNWLINYINFD